MKFLHNVILFKGPGVQITQEQSERLSKVLTGENPPKFVELKGELVAVSNIAQVEKSDPEPGQQKQIEAPPITEEQRAKNLAALRKAKDQFFISQAKRRKEEAKQRATDRAAAAKENEARKAEMDKAELELAEHNKKRKAK